MRTSAHSDSHPRPLGHRNQALFSDIYIYCTTCQYISWIYLFLFSTPYDNLLYIFIAKETNTKSLSRTIKESLQDYDCNKTWQMVLITKWMVFNVRVKSSWKPHNNFRIFDGTTRYICLLKGHSHITSYWIFFNIFAKFVFSTL